MNLDFLLNMWHRNLHESMSDLRRELFKYISKLDARVILLYLNFLKFSIFNNIKRGDGNKRGAKKKSRQARRDCKSK